MDREKKQGFGFIGGVFTGVLATSLIVLVGFLLGQSTAESKNAVENTVISNVGSSAADDIVTMEFLQKVNTIETLVDEIYYLDEVGADAMREGAYEGIVAALGDIYSVYYTPEEAEEVFQQSEGIYYGIGAYVQMDTVTGYAKITGTIKNTPAEEAGLQAGDILYILHYNTCSMNGNM